jgi:hypothetical protein
MTTGVACPLVIPQFFNNLGEPAVGGSVLTQVGGINAATYQDSGLTTALPNPIPLNSRGEVSNAIGASCQLFLTPNTVYTFTLYDANGNQLWVATYVNGVQVILSQATIGALLYPQTAAEIAAGVTPTSLWYPEMNVLRYGATGGGSINDSAAFQAAINVAKVAGGEVFIPKPSVYYLLTSALDCTVSASATYTAGFTVRMEGNPHFSANSPSGSIYAQHTSHVFDCTGNSAIDFYDLCVSTNASTTPQTCFLLARNTSGASQVFRFFNCRVFGYFSVSLFYNYGSEDEQLIGCYFENYAATANGFNNAQYPKVCTWTANNIAAVTSINAGIIATGAQSTRHHHVVGGNFANAGAQASSDVFYLDQCFFLEVLHAWVACASGRAIVYVDPTNGTSSSISLIDLETEAGAAPAEFVQFSNPASGQTPVNWLLESCSCDIATYVLNAGVNITCSGFRIRNCYSTGGGINISGTLGYSFVECDALALTIATVSNSTIIGSSAGWTITTRTASKFLDTSAATSRTWTPSAGSFTGTGVGFADTEYTTDGTRCTVSFDVSASGGNLAYTAGTAITGLPFPATRTPGLVSVYDFTGTTYIGSGWVDGNGLHLANSITSTAHVFFIEAQYFVG